MCRAFLTAHAADPEPAVVLGEECHIVSPRPGGPRYRTHDSPPAYDNLILLCPSDHETVDKQPRHYTEERLREIKRQHELWVRSLPGAPQVRIRRDASRDSPIVRLAESGSHLLAAAGGAHAAEVVTPEVADTAEADLVGGFVQSVQDWAEIWDEIPMAARLRAELDLTAALNELAKPDSSSTAAAGATCSKGEPAVPPRGEVALLCVFRIGDPQIMVEPEDSETTPASRGQ